LGKLGWRRQVGPQRPEEVTLTSLWSPVAQPESATRAKNPRQLRRGDLVARSEHAAERRKHHLEAVVRRGHRFRVALDPLDADTRLRRQSAASFEKLGGQVETDHRPDVLEAHSGGGPLQIRSEFDEVINFGGRKAQTFRVEVFEPNTTLEVAAIAGLGIRPTQRFTLSNKAGSTTVEIHVTVRTQGLFRLLEPLLSKMIATKWREYSGRLRGLLENQPVMPSSELHTERVG
jgi:hypothetical protein